MIYIVEIPHQRQPFCWSALDEADAIAKIYKAGAGSEYLPVADTPFDEWLQFNERELSAQWVFMNKEEAIDGLCEIYGHNAVPAIAALRNELEATGELPEGIDNEVDN